MLKKQLMESFGSIKVINERVAKFVELVNESYLETDRKQKKVESSKKAAKKKLSTLKDQLSTNSEIIDTLNRGLTHEIKNHIANWKGLLQLMQKFETKENQASFAPIQTMLNTTANQMSSVLDSFLYITNAEGQIDSDYQLIVANKLQLQIESEVSHLTTSTSKRVAYTFNTKGLYYSPHILRICVVNLVTTALKFKDSSGMSVVSVDLNYDQTGVLLDVSFNGSSREFDVAGLRHIFSSRSNMHSNKPDLGLRVVRKILERNNGEVEIRTGAIQKITINLYLPINQSHEF
ncbi:MAG: hypothetical protein R2813_12650 [Flavobacteriales bacterium]